MTKHLPSALLASFILIISGCYCPIDSDGGSSLAPKPILRVGQPGQIFNGKVVGITDGDTIRILVPTNQEVIIRLAEIDAPEKHQAYGSKSKQVLSDKIFGKEVTVKIVSIDRYKRTVAQVFIGDRWINKEMVAEGWAWQYLQYSDSKDLIQAELVAREKNLGLWADKNPIPPWEWRKPTQVKPDDETQLQPLFKVGW